MNTEIKIQNMLCTASQAEVWGGGGKKFSGARLQTCALKLRCRNTDLTERAHGIMGTQHTIDQ